MSSFSCAVFIACLDVFSVGEDVGRDGIPTRQCNSTVNASGTDILLPFDSFVPFDQLRKPNFHFVFSHVVSSRE